jgi:hypothetical protein
MADICPNCKSADVQAQFHHLNCLNCGAALDYADDGSGSFTARKDETLAAPGPADTSLATPTATPVYAEQESDRQPAVDTNLEPVPSDAKPGVTTKPAPDLEAVNVAGELSDETPQEKKTGGPDDQPRTAELTKAGKPKKDTLVDHSTDEQVQPEYTEPTKADHKNLDPKKRGK